MWDRFFRRSAPAHLEDWNRWPSVRAQLRATRVLVSSWHSCPSGPRRPPELGRARLQPQAQKGHLALGGRFSRGVGAAADGGPWGWLAGEMCAVWRRRGGGAGGAPYALCDDTN